MNNLSDLAELQVKFYAFSIAASEMIASTMGKIVVLRQMLSERLDLSDQDYKAELKLFGEQRWPTFVTEVSARLKSLAEEKERKLRETMNGPVN